jgi:hypothetical protein
MKFHILKLVSIYTLISQIIFLMVTIIVGIITPGYNHITHTISRLSIEKFGYIQQFNFIQFGISLLLSGLLFFKITPTYKLRTIWLSIFTFSSLFIFTETLFPTDIIEDINIYSSQLTLNGYIHLFSLALFFILAPFGSYLLSKYMQVDSMFTNMASMTKFGGYMLSTLCYIWIYYFLSVPFALYLGIFQKVIVGIGFLWLLQIHWLVYKQSCRVNRS